MTKTAITAAEVERISLVWLKIFDRGDYSCCWKIASAELKKQVSEEDFASIMSARHSSQDTVVSRKLIDAGTDLVYHRQPDVIHRVLRFEVVLEAGCKRQELVTLVKGEHAVCQVANYTVL